MRIETTAVELRPGDRIVEWQGVRWSPQTVISVRVTEAPARYVGTSIVRDPAAVMVTMRSGSGSKVRGGRRELRGSDELIVERAA